MLPEEYKKKLVEKLNDEAAKALRTKEETVKKLYEEKLEGLRKEYEEAVKRFAGSLTS